MIDKTHSLSSRAAPPHATPSQPHESANFADMLVMLAPQASKASDPATVAAAHAGIESSRLAEHSSSPSGSPMATASIEGPSRPAGPGADGANPPPGSAPAGDAAAGRTATGVTAGADAATTPGAASNGPGAATGPDGTTSGAATASGPATPATADAASGPAPSGVPASAFAALLDPGGNQAHASASAAPGSTAPSPSAPAPAAPGAPAGLPAGSAGPTGPAAGSASSSAAPSTGSSTASGATSPGGQVASTKAAPVPDAGPTASTLHLLSAMAPTPASTDAAPVAAASAPAPGAPATPADQLAEVIVPFNRRPDGSYHISLKLQPEGLGDVHVSIQIHASTIQLHIQAQGGATRDLLRQNMDELRRQLEASGFSSAQCEVGGGGAQFTGSSLPNGASYVAPTGSAAAGDATATATDATSSIADLSPSPTQAPDGSLDLRL